MKLVIVVNTKYELREVLEVLEVANDEIEIHFKQEGE